MDLKKEARLCIIRKAARKAQAKRKAETRRAIELRKEQIALNKAIMGEL